MPRQQYQEIPLAKIIIPEERARSTFSPEQEEELKTSIKEHGFNVPILVRATNDGNYELIDGEHRINIVKEMGWEKIPSIVTEIDDKKFNILNFLANTARGTQDPISISEALNKASGSGATIEELSAATGHSEGWVRKYMAYSKLPDVYKDAMREMKLAVGAVDEALRLSTPEEVDHFLGQQLIHQWPIDVTKRLIDNRLAELDAAKKRAEVMGEEAKVEEPDYSQLAQYDECWHCKRMIPKGNVFMHLICRDCKNLLDYVLAHISDPTKALDYVYKAMERQMKYEKYKELQKEFEEKKSETKETPPKEESSPIPSPTEKKLPFPISSDEIVKPEE